MDSITKGIIIQIKNELKEIENKVTNVKTIINDFEKYCDSSSTPSKDDKTEELTPEEQEEIESMAGAIAKAARQSDTISRILETAKKNGTKVIGVPPGGGMVIGVDQNMNVDIKDVLDLNSAHNTVPNVKIHTFYNDNVKARYGGRKISNVQNGKIISLDVENDHDIVYNATQVMKDIAKIDFDLENIVEQRLESINGCNYLGVLAGGDWEYPVWFFIYSDEKSLRGYVPIRGNAVNTINKSAFGNGEDQDKQYLNKYGHEEPMDSFVNYEECKKEFECRVGLRKVDKNGIPEEA